MKRIFSEMKNLRYALLAIAATALLLGGCGGGGGSSYDEPTTVTNPAIPGVATNVLIEPETLKSWMDAGKVNAADSFDGKVVILDYASDNTAMHIPGALKVHSTELTASRLEGLAVSGSMVATGAMMDAVIERLGIDQNTTIVITTAGGTNMYQATRAYFVFRYWGFPKAKLKVLDGGNQAWDAHVAAQGWGAGYALTDVLTGNPTPSTFSVRNLGTLCDDLRYSIGEMITEVYPALQDGTMLHLDALGEAHATATAKNFTTSLNQAGKWVVFEGRIRNSKPLAQGSLYNANNNYRFKTPEAIRALFEDQNVGWRQGLPTVTACRAGISCTTLFFALDAILDSPAYVYDGSWGQWGLYSTLNTSTNGKIPTTLTGERSKWAVDQFTISGPMNSPVPGPVYNVGFVKTVNNADYTLSLTDIESVTINTSVLYNTNGPADPAANQIENEDREYIETPPAGSGATGPVSGGAGGGC
ncbi:selenite/tellurite reduction operon rhodanese-like protein ExtH [Trichloromonas acetexigens]|uniref:Rhodanese domain-containing protein n=1 Tax=Trichloromonas acetexigens TaxID=38815 RepID=A0A550JB55_9BACT|nr:selenite/tellurite reduction operon rhodanese-like protein ExtH [Desulfuromonas acetexigens]TRO80499.1 hypothetical protein FL622_10385 [Desulfuromonas acetexigens]